MDTLCTNHVNMKFTLSADERLIAEARAYASQHNTSLNQLVRDYLGSLVGGSSAEAAMDEFEFVALHMGGRSDGRPWTGRDALYGDRGAPRR